MGAGAFLEPLVVISLLVGGTLINREKRSSSSGEWWAQHKRNDSVESGSSSPKARDQLLESSSGYLQQGRGAGWRYRKIQMLGWHVEVRSPDTQHFSERLLSRVLRNFPFLVEVWYWALIYWVYQLGRAFTAVTIVQGTVHTARRHALQLIHLEQRLRLFWEPAIQQSFLQYPLLMHWINRIYSFIHIPGTILFLIWLFYLTITANRPGQRRDIERSQGGPPLYQARRRTMAMCNLIAFVVFTAWPCMPPRLLSDPAYEGQNAAEAKSFGFVDTVHGAGGESSVWTQNKVRFRLSRADSLDQGGLTSSVVLQSIRRDAESSLRL